MKDLSKLAGLASLNAVQNSTQEDRVLLLDPDQILVKDQVRKKFNAIEELAESMKIQQQQPIVVGPLDKDTGKYPLQKGERRWRAAKLIGGEFKLKAIVDSTVRSQSQSSMSQLIENIQREDLSPLEIARQLVKAREEMRAEGKKGTGRELAAEAKKPESWISRHLALADLPDEIAQLLDDDITIDSEILHSLKQIGELDNERLKALLAVARDPDMPPLSRDQVRQELRDAKGGGKEGKGGAKASQAVNTDNGGTSPNKQAAGAGSTEQGQTESSAPGTQTQQEPESAPSKQGAGGNEQQSKTPPTPPEPARAPGTGGKVQPKLHKAEVMSIEPAKMVVQVRVAMDEVVLTGELLLNKISGDPHKGLVSVLIGGRPVEKLVRLDQLEIVTMMELADD